MAVTRYLMGLDIGTSGCKATVFNELGEFCCSSYREYPAENYDGRIDAGLVWEKVKEVMAECAACYSEIDAVCTTSFGETVVAVDRSGKVLAPAILYTDDNAAQELSEIESLVGKKRIAEITGLIAHPMYTISRLCRMKRCQPEVWNTRNSGWKPSGKLKWKISRRLSWWMTKAMISSSKFRRRSAHAALSNVNRPSGRFFLPHEPPNDSFILVNTHKTNASGQCRNIT